MQLTLNLCQRWTQRRASYRPAGETITPSQYEVAEIPGDGQARAFVIEHHYSRTYPVARFRFGLYRHGSLVGVAVFSVPSNDLALTNVFKVPALAAVELGRFVLVDSVPANGETWFLARCFAALRQLSIVGVISFSDPMPRRTEHGVTHPGHVGTIYQAHNGVYLGRATARTLQLLPDGSVFSDRTAQKIRRLEKGWEYGAQQLRQFGAPAIDLEHRAEWLNSSLRSIARRLRHRGNHKYAWPLAPALRAQLPASLPFPKHTDASLDSLS